MASLVVTGNRLHAQERPGIIVSLALLQMALGLEKRRRWREKDAKGTQGGILNAGAGVWPCLAMVRQGSDPSRQDTLEIIEASGGCHGDLLSSQGRTMVALAVSFGNRQPLASQIYNC